MNRLLLFCGILFLVIGCTDEEPINPENLGLKYYPLQTGNYWIYQVTETRYQNQFAQAATDSSTYFVREHIDTVFQDLTGEDTYKFTRSRRASITEEWGQDSLYTVNKSATDVQLTQNNRRVVAFIFPVAEGKKWNAHIFNAQSAVDNLTDASFYSFANTGQSKVINGKTYANTVQLNQLQNDNAIEKQELYEVYGYGVGRIFKQKLSYQYCSDPDRQSGCAVGTGFIIKGVKITEKLIEHGSSK